MRDIDDELHALVAGKISVNCQIKCLSVLKNPPLILSFSQLIYSANQLSLSLSPLSVKVSWLEPQCSSTKARRYPCISSQSWWR